MVEVYSVIKVHALYPAEERLSRDSAARTDSKETQQKAVTLP
jgi:hypothetical protein